MHDYSGWNGRSCLWPLLILALHQRLFDFRNPAKWRMMIPLRITSSNWSMSGPPIKSSLGSVSKPSMSITSKNAPTPSQLRVRFQLYFFAMNSMFFYFRHKNIYHQTRPDDSQRNRSNSLNISRKKYSIIYFCNKLLFFKYLFLE